MTQEKRRSLVNEIHRLRTQQPIDGKNYRQMTLFFNEYGKMDWSCSTNFGGFTEKPRREIRVPSYVDPSKAMRLYNEIKQPACLVNTVEDLFIWMHIGGHCVIEGEIADKYFSDLMNARPTVRSYADGFIDVESLKSYQEQHAVTPKLRMRVLRRDNFKCKLCGRSPSNYTDIELHVHHIIPWSEGGITEMDNLITLCHTCHKGLDPHHDAGLYGFLGKGFLENALSQGDKYVERMQTHIVKSPKVFERFNAKAKSKQRKLLPPEEG